MAGWLVPSTFAVALVLAGCGSSGPSAGPTSGPASMTTSAAATPPATEPSATPTGCLRPDGNCLGVLGPGTYESKSFAVFGSPAPQEFSYTVEDGTWANALDHAAGYWFQVAGDYAQSNGDATLDGVYLFSDVAAAQQKYPSCSEASDPSVPTDARSLISWIGKISGLQTRPLPAMRTTNGPAPGISIRALAGTRPKCYDHATLRTLIASRKGASDSYVWGLATGEAIDAYFLDLEDGHTVGILVYSPTGEISPGLARRARHLIASFHFQRPS